MNKAATPLLPKLLLVGVASATMAIGASAAVSATTEPPTDSAAPAAGSAAPDTAAFCDAAVAAVASTGSEDPAVMMPAFEALVAASPEDIRPAVEAVIATDAEPGDPEFDEPWTAMIDYVRANCGFAEINASLSEYTFGGVPEEVPAGPTILTAEAIGAEVHEMIIIRINDDVTLSVEEFLALPEEEADTMVTFLGGVFGVFPETSQSTLLDLTPGRYVAICFFPQGSTPEVFEQMMAAEEAAAGSIPEGSAPADSATEGTAPTGTEHADMATDTASAEGSAPVEGSAPAEGSAPEGEEGTPHAFLGMIQEFTVV